MQISDLKLKLCSCEMKKYNENDYYVTIDVLQGVKKVPLLIEILVGITLKFQLKGVLFSGHAVLLLCKLPSCREGDLICNR